MQNIKGWSLIICLATISCTIIELLLPPGKMSKTMYIIISLFILCCGVFSLSNLQVPNIFSKPKITKNSDFLNSMDFQISNLACENIKTIVERKLSDIGVIPKKIEIFMDTIKDNCILMIRCNIYIENKYQNSKQDIYKAISEKLNIPTKIIDV